MRKAKTRSERRERVEKSELEGKKGRLRGRKGRMKQKKRLPLLKRIGSQRIELKIEGRTERR